MRALALLAGSMIVALLLCETLVRATWSWSMPAGERPARAAPARPRPERVDPELPVYRTLFDLGQPNADGVFKGLPYRTNSAGFRGPELPERAEPGVFRIVVGGDSVTMGSGVLEEDAYPARLGALLAERLGGRRVEVLNLGLSGLNSRWVVDRIARIGMRYHPDLLVYGYTLNDIEGPDYVATVTPEMVKAKRERYRRFVDSPSYLLRAVWPRWLALTELIFKPRGTQEYDVHHNYFENPRAWGQVEASLDRLAELGRRHGICVHLMIHTGVAQLNRLYPFLGVDEKLREAAEQRGIGVTQTFPYFEGRDPSEIRISFFDTHPNAAGHEILATALADGLAALPARCWKGAEAP